MKIIRPLSSDSLNAGTLTKFTSRLFRCSVKFDLPDYHPLSNFQTHLVSPCYVGNDEYGFIVDNDDFTSKKLTTKLLQQIQVGRKT